MSASGGAGAPLGMTCEELVELVTDYLELALTPDERARFGQHLLLCPPCLDYLGQVKAQLALAPRLADHAVPPAIHARLLDLFRQARREAAPPSPASEDPRL